MGRQPRAGGRYVQPIDSTGAPVTPDTAGDARHGVYLLAAATQYYYILGGIDAPFLSVHITGYDAALILTSAVIQDCDHHDNDVSDFSAVAGEWLTESPTTSYIAVAGAGWAQTPSTGILTVAGGAVGGALFHFDETAAARHRLSVLVGGAGGHVRVSCHGKM